MKPNVDLTLNKDFESKNGNVSYKFSKNSNIATVAKLRDLFNSMFKKEYPWTHNNILGSTLDYKQLFFSGNKSERARKKKGREYEEECECCGADLSKKPWSNHYKLCEKCNNWLEEDQENRSLWLKILKNK